MYISKNGTNLDNLIDKIKDVFNIYLSIDLGDVPLLSTGLPLYRSYNSINYYVNLVRFYITDLLNTIPLLSNNCFLKNIYYDSKIGIVVELDVNGDLISVEINRN